VAKRRTVNDLLRKGAGTLNASAAQKLESYEARLLKVRVAMAAERDQARQAGEKDAQIRLEAAGQEARSLRQQAARRLRGESAEAQAALQGRVDDFAQQAVSRLLGA
jgi:F0F1-type ATP synthase membrane subunit b/b'